MSEIDPFMKPQEAQVMNERIQDRELAYLGALVMEAAMRDDLNDVVEQHTAMTGEGNPNSVPADGTAGLIIGSAEVPMTSDNVYRQVHDRAIEDLAKSGIVRNPVTAGLKDGTRWGHRVFWNVGEDGKNAQLGGRVVIEADKNAARNSWVTADKVNGIYAKDSDGTVKNIIAPNK